MLQTISIIIPALNEEKYIGKLLESLAQQDFHGKLEVILVDGNSKDKTVEVAKQFQTKLSDFTILRPHKRGISYQRNLGAKKAKYTYLLFLDADMYLPKHFLNRLAKKVKPNERFVATVNEWIIEQDPILMALAILAYPFTVTAFWIEKYLPGFFILTTKQHHEKIGGFDQTITLGEDLDYAKRSTASGARYHFYFYPIARLSARRAKKMGYLKFLIFLWRVLLHTKLHGPATLSKQFDNYPFGEH